MKKNQQNALFEVTSSFITVRFLSCEYEHVRLSDLPEKKIRFSHSAR